MNRSLIAASLLFTTTMTFSAAYADDHESMSFSWTAEEICLVGAPGTIQSNGDVTNNASQIPAFGAGVITFHPARGTAIDTGNWMFFLPFFVPPPPPDVPPMPQNVFPARTSTGQCNWTYLRGKDLSWTLEAPKAGCGGPDTSGPNEGRGPFTFTNGAKIEGQFAADMNSFVAHRSGLVIENGLDPSGNSFERICMRNIQGARIPIGRR